MQHCNAVTSNDCAVQQHNTNCDVVWMDFKSEPICTPGSRGASWSKVPQGDNAGAQGGLNLTTLRSQVRISTPQLFETIIYWF